MNDHFSAKLRIAEQYRGDKGLDYHARKHSQDPFVQQVVMRERAAKLQPLINEEDSILEFGVGTGLNLLLLKCTRRTGYDLSEAGRRTCEEAGIRYVTDLATVSEENFDAVICHHVLEHVPDPVQVLETMRGLLRPGGRLLLCVPFETLRFYRHFRPGDPDQHLFSWNALTLGNLVTKAGFAIESCRIHPFGYEQRLAPMARWGVAAYRLGLRVIRWMRPADEVFLVARAEAPGAQRGMNV